MKLSKSILIIMFMAAVFLVSFVAAGYYSYVAPRPPSLRILFTNSEQMLNDVASAFKEWYGHPVEVELVATDPQTAYERVTNIYRKPEAEIWWGGPVSLFKKARGSLLAYNSTNKMAATTCHFCPLIDREENTPRWYAANLHGLGLMYNEAILGDVPPRNWSSLLTDEFEGNLTMVDPTLSEFTQPFIMLILQSQDWTSGWEYLVRSSAFVTQFDSNEADSALKVASGYLPTAVVPDFFAYDKMDPPFSGISFTYLDTTILQPDPIAIIRRGTHLAEAKAFIDFILTREAQTIIGKYRLPIHENATVTPPRINPFAPNFPHILNYNQTFEEIGEDIVKDYYKTWIADRHQEIQTAWSELDQANRTSPHYELAWNNFTLAGTYTQRTEIDAIYNETNGWSEAEKVAAYIDEWHEASTEAYINASENARKSK